MARSAGDGYAAVLGARLLYTGPNGQVGPIRPRSLAEMCRRLVPAAKLAADLGGSWPLAPLGGTFRGQNTYRTSGTLGSGAMAAHASRTWSSAGSNEQAMVRTSPASALR